MVEYKHSFNTFSLILVLQLILLNPTNTLLADENKLTAKENRVLKDTFKYVESLEPKKLKIDKKTYARYSNFESIFKFNFSGKKIVSWIQSRIKSYSSGATGDFVAYYQNGDVVLGKQFFNLNRVDRFLTILHEARHADGKSFSHINCPENFAYLNPRDLKISPANKKACDEKWDGSYGISASVIFELGAYGYLTSTDTAYRYNSEISRIVPEE